ncbi:MAG: MarR family winged helix-turn-helix transcriptional regulator [Alphaproteobacteria bacterium]|nr:MarR family winged helix-turn-helix transcriptional regulator [Alphaproteobacteria bacterium]
MTQVFDEILEPCGLRSTQFIILASIGADEPTTHGKLANALVMDGSTVTRNLKPLVAKGLVAKTRGGGSRLLHLALTDAGRQAVADALPLWEHAQSRFVDTIGDGRWQDLRQAFAATVEAARQSPPARER